MNQLLLRALFVLLLIGCSSFFLHAQQKRKPPIVSGNTSLNAGARPTPKSSKKIYVIYKTDFKGTMSGNKCVEDLSWKMGFRYEQLMKKGPGSKTQEGIFFHNLGTRTLLLFRNGPFWQMCFKKKMKECQKMTGDFMG